jgi:SAM-dependent methyltransferase
MNALKLIKRCRKGLSKFWMRCQRGREIRRLHAFGYDKINFGCGFSPLPNWTNIDGGDDIQHDVPHLESVVRLDVWKALSEIPDCATRFVTSEHFFEHFDRLEGHRLLKQWFRILKPGGVVRIVMPDLDNEVRCYLGLLPGLSWEKDQLPHRLVRLTRLKGPYQLIEGERYTRAIDFNNGLRSVGHRFFYDFETIDQSLRLAGFTGVKRQSFRDSDFEELRGIDLHDGGDTGRHWIPKPMLVIEGLKSAGGGQA